MQPTIAERVQNGIDWLDANASPDWEDQINLRKLDIHSCKKCILGQLGLWESYSGPMMSRGFLPPHVLVKEEGKVLDEEWTRRIKRRQDS